MASSKPNPVRLCVLGPSGRMGREVLAAAAERDDVVVVSAADRPGSELIGTEVADGCTVSDDVGAAVAAADVYIDFTAPAATLAAARAAASSHTAAVIGTTGLTDAARAALDVLAEAAPVLEAPNFSLGVNLLVHLCEQAARALGPEFDLEVVELHHRRKRDAPSGTALAVGEALARGRGLDFRRAAVLAREGDVGPREDAEIGIVAVRGGDIVGEHTAYLIGADERIEISHRAMQRSIFARGAVRAAIFVAGKQPGMYSMRDVLGLEG